MFYGVNLLCQPRLAECKRQCVCACAWCVCVYFVYVCVIWVCVCVLCGYVVYVCMCVCVVYLHMLCGRWCLWRMFVCLYVLCLCGCGVLCMHCVCCVCVCCPAPLINKLQRVISQADGLPSHPFLSLSCLCLPLFSSDHRGLPIIPVPNWLVGWAGEKVLPEAMQWLREIHPPGEVASSLWSEFWVQRCPGAISTIWEGPGSTGVPGLVFYC